LCLVTSFGRIQFASAYGLVRASQIRHSKAIGFSAKVHAASVLRRLGGAPIKLFGLLRSIRAWRCPCLQTGCTIEFWGKNIVKGEPYCTEKFLYRLQSDCGGRPCRQRSGTHYSITPLGRSIYAAWRFMSETKLLRVRFALHILIAQLNHRIKCERRLGQL
jgi:hypothetical protein